MKKILFLLMLISAACEETIQPSMEACAATVQPKSGIYCPDDSYKKGENVQDDGNDTYIIHFEVTKDGITTQHDVKTDCYIWINDIRSKNKNMPDHTLTPMDMKPHTFRKIFILEYGAKGGSITTFRDLVGDPAFEAFKAAGLNEGLVILTRWMVDPICYSMVPDIDPNNLENATLICKRIPNYLPAS